MIIIHMEIHPELQEAITKYNKNEITLKELVAVHQKLIIETKGQTEEILVSLPLSSFKNGNDGKFIIYDRIIDRNPKTPEGDNRTRDEFAFSAYYHPKGKFFTDWKSKMIIPAINLAHKMILKGYDMDAYVFDDPRLQAQNQHFRNYIKENFRNAEYKMDFMNKIVDIVMFLRKEDPYYCRLIDMIETMPRFGLTETEKKNIEIWH